MELILLVQWHQTYSILSNPLAAMKTLERNWAKVAQFTLIVLYSLFMVFDIVVVIIDNNSEDHREGDFIIAAYKFLMIIQVILSLILLVCYVILLTLFLHLIRRDEKRFSALYKQVIGFFSIILVLLTSNLVLQIVFYLEFHNHPADNDEQAWLVDITSYIHTSQELIFDVVLLGYLISQAGQNDLPVAPTGSPQIEPVSRSYTNST